MTAQKSRPGEKATNPNENSFESTSETNAAGFVRSYRGAWLPAMIVARDFVHHSRLPVTLRQVFYALVSRQLLENTESNYRALSERTAEERRAGTFPALADNGRTIQQTYADKSPKDALLSVANTFQLDRTIGQPHQIWVLAEKRGMAPALWEAFGKYGAYVLGLGGYASQTILDDVARMVRLDARPAIALYGGDFDATGEDIARHFREGTGCWAEWVQVALTPAQVDEYNLPENPGKASDSRSKAFQARHGRSVQVEVDALDPNELDRLYREAFARFHDKSTFDEIPVRERDSRQRMLSFIDGWDAFDGGERI